MDKEGVLNDRGDSPPPEHLLQSIWQFQRLKRDSLQLTDGRKLEVLHPGFLNQEAGPDFSKALLRIDGELLKEGDVEIETDPAGWKNHGHSKNPSFKNVSLLAYWDSSPLSDLDIPQIDLSPFLDSPIRQLSDVFGNASLVLVPEEWKGKCAGPLSILTTSQMHELLQQAAECRLDMKASLIQARAQDVGWDQSLHEALFRGLGYKQNAWPMQGLAERMVRHITQDSGNLSSKQSQALLLGAAGLLPQEEAKVTDPFLKDLWSRWWRERSSLIDHCLPKSLWRFHGLRPANHPQRRIALGACWISDKGLIRNLEDWFFKAPVKERISQLLEVLNPGPVEFWSRHWTFQSPMQPTDAPLIGQARATDLAVNAILPWFRARALAGKDDTTKQRVRDIYFDWPASQDNVLLRKARQRLLPGSLPRHLNKSSLQQGLIQIAADFCSHTTSDCAQCQFPELVKSLASAPSE